MKKLSENNGPRTSISTDELQEQLDHNEKQLYREDELGQRHLQASGRKVQLPIGSRSLSYLITIYNVYSTPADVCRSPFYMCFIYLLKL